MTSHEAADAEYQRYLEVQAEADRAREAAGSAPEVGTPQGDLVYDLDHAADVAYERYSAAWADAHYPETTAEAKAYLAELDAQLGPDPEAETDLEAGI
jgi:hypothetical protein